MELRRGPVASRHQAWWNCHGSPEDNLVRVGKRDAAKSSLSYNQVLYLLSVLCLLLDLHLHVLAAPRDGLLGLWLVPRPRPIKHVLEHLQAPPLLRLRILR